MVLIVTPSVWPEPQAELWNGRPRDDWLFLLTLGFSWL